VIGFRVGNNRIGLRFVAGTDSFCFSPPLGGLWDPHNPGSGFSGIGGGGGGGVKWHGSVGFTTHPSSSSESKLHVRLSTYHHDVVLRRAA
jgi:hypothetical protein